MRWYGETPLSYACVFGLRQLVRKLLKTGCVDFHTSCGEITGLYPLHAVAASGNRQMYDYLLKGGLPPHLMGRCGESGVGSGRLSSLQLEGMTALQLTAQLGLRHMFQHVSLATLLSMSLCARAGGGCGDAPCSNRSLSRPRLFILAPACTY